MKVLVVASTRPELIKLAPVLKELKNQGITHYFATTGQHYDRAMFHNFIEELDLDPPEKDIMVGSGSQAEQTGKVMVGVERLIQNEEPTVVVVEGDTNSVLGSALAAVKQKVPVAHVEAGLRSFDRTMPEEINRILTDHSSELLFSPTEVSALNLVDEGINAPKIKIVGNTVVDATLSNIEKAEKQSDIRDRFGEGYYLLTLHRQENTDSPGRMTEIFNALGQAEKEIIFPIHPRTEKIIEGTPLGAIIKRAGIKVIPPTGYHDFLMLLKDAKAVFTDSGGVQEEAITLNTPCLTLRYNTERPETIQAGGNILVGTSLEKIKEALKKLDDKDFYKKMKKARNPYGDGTSGSQIVRILKEDPEVKVGSADQLKGFAKRIYRPVSSDLAGKKVNETGLPIQRIIDGPTSHFPQPGRVLKAGEILELLET